MYCRECGKEIPDDANYCNICGTQVKHNTDTDESYRRSVIKPSFKGINRKTIKSAVIMLVVAFLEVAVFVSIVDIRDKHEYWQREYRYAKKCIDYAENHPEEMLEMVVEAEEWLEKTQDKLIDGATQKQRQEIEKFVNEYYEKDTDNASGDTYSENKEKKQNIDVKGEGLSEQVLKEIGGHYEDGNGDTIDFVDSEHMVRFILGGNESHTYEEKIGGYENVNDGYLLKVENGGEKYTYLYQAVGGEQRLYLGYEDGWEPELEPYDYVSIQIYVKKTNELRNDVSNSMEDSSIWGLDDVFEGGIPEEVFEQIKGTYSDSYRVAKFISQYEVKFGFTDDSLVLFEILGCEARNETLYIYATDGTYQYTFSVNKDTAGECILKYCVGQFSPEQFSPDAIMYRIDEGDFKEYILPDSASRLLTENDLVGLTNDDLRKARNEILARHGRKFNDTELQSYFNMQSWYNGVIEPEDFNSVVKLSDIEQKNIDFIKQHENR